MPLCDIYLVSSLVWKFTASAAESVGQVVRTTPTTLWAYIYHCISCSDKQASPTYQPSWFLSIVCSKCFYLSELFTVSCWEPQASPTTRMALWAASVDWWSVLCQLLRATGKPYHPDCFTCVVCGKSLDGIPFTVDATNQIHCIEDFHKWALNGVFFWREGVGCCVCWLFFLYSKPLSNCKYLYIYIYRYVIAKAVLRHCGNTHNKVSDSHCIITMFSTWLLYFYWLFKLFT